MKTKNTASKHIEELNEMVFGEPQPDAESVLGTPVPVGDFEKRCQALRGWRVGDFAAIPELEETGVVVAKHKNGDVVIDVFENPVTISLLEMGLRVINLSRGE